MATLDEFTAQYQAYYGKFPVYSNDEVGRATLNLWKRFVSTLTPEKMSRSFEVTNDHRAQQGIRTKPLLEAFQRALSVVDAENTDGGFKSAELRHFEEQMKTPLFDFSKPGHPRRREAYLIELPKANRPSTADLFETGFDPKVYKAEVMRCFNVSWADYTEEEQRFLCRKWNIEMPEEERIPF